MTDSSNKDAGSAQASGLADTATMMSDLRKEVDVWNNERRTSDAPVAPAAPKAKAAPARASRASKAAAVPAERKVPETGTAKRPFKMSYDGVTAAEYAADRFSRGRG